MSTSRSEVWFACAEFDTQFLPVIEAGTISLIASTTENPSFRINNALLSRCRVFVLEKLTAEDIYKVLVRALGLVRTRPSSSDPIPSTSTSSPPDYKPDLLELLIGDMINEDLLRFLAAAADGDARVALSSLELALAAVQDGSGAKMSPEELKTSLRKAHLQYDRNGGEYIIHLILCVGGALLIYRTQTNFRRSSLRHNLCSAQICTRRRCRCRIVLASAHASRRGWSIIRCSENNSHGELICRRSHIEYRDRCATVTHDVTNHRRVKILDWLIQCFSIKL